MGYSSTPAAKKEDVDASIATAASDKPGAGEGEETKVAVAVVAE